MNDPSKWQPDKGAHGMQVVTITSWKYFHELLEFKFLNFKDYVFRGQSNEIWELAPTFNRFLMKRKDTNYNVVLNNHLENFKYSLRGRFPNLKDIINDENELWALGQHHGLHTPLLDFTFSPYVAAYFAFFEKQTESEYRSIYCISQSAVDKEIGKELHLYKPFSDNNPRLLNQSGLFVKFNTDLNIETLFKKTFNENETNLKLLKLRLPNSDRETCLKLLNRMNINHNTLFPDISGASLYCNTDLEIKNY